MDVRVDGDGLLRRVTTEMGAPAAQPTPAVVGITTDLFEFGVAVDVEHPPAAKVLDLANARHARALTGFSPDPRAEALP